MKSIMKALRVLSYRKLIASSMNMPGPLASSIQDLGSIVMERPPFSLDLCFS